jgi:hypothetical protein
LHFKGSGSTQIDHHFDHIFLTIRVWDGLQARHNILGITHRQRFFLGRAEAGGLDVKH